MRILSFILTITLLIIITFALSMKDRIHIMLFACLMLITIGYSQVFYKIEIKQGQTITLFDNTDESSTEEELDQDEVFIDHNDIKVLPSFCHIIISSNTNFAFPILYLEIISPPPRA